MDDKLVYSYCSSCLKVIQTWDNNERQGNWHTKEAVDGYFFSCPAQSKNPIRLAHTPDDLLYAVWRASNDAHPA